MNLLLSNRDAEAFDDMALLYDAFMQKSMGKSSSSKYTHTAPHAYQHIKQQALDFTLATKEFIAGG